MSLDGSIVGSNSIFQNELIKETMKLLMAAILGVGGALLAGCAESPTADNTGVRNAPYSAYATNRYNYVAADSPYRKWTTAQLQQRRKDLYATVPYRQDRHGTPVYQYVGQPLPQQDEIFAIEAELNRRYQAGDKSAEPERPIPGTTHIATNPI
jgi:hypothetical protein